MADPQLTDKAPLDVYLAAIHHQVDAFIERVETQHPLWRARNFTITVRCALRPTVPGPDGSVVVYADMDLSRSQQVTEIAIPFQRLPLPE
jgi:hypothetical protein